jgi:ATPase subunit of ABC transporter with duplicated ATPase domains
MLILKHISKSFGGQSVFTDVSFVVHRGDVVGLVGVNGAGKSTLLRIIAGEEEPDSGDVVLDGERVGYLSQEVLVEPATTLAEFLDWDLGARTQMLLGQVGLADISPETLVEQLSGGQKTRLGLVRTLLARPTCLLLDEPTNHLDADSLRLLEAIVRQFHGMVIVVSHDRAFLQATTNRIVELDPLNEQCTEYTGGYDAYIVEREKRRVSWEAAYADQQREKRRLESILHEKRQLATAFDSPAFGRQVRHMEKRIAREIEAVAIDRPLVAKAMAELHFGAVVPEGKLILRATDITCGYHPPFLCTNVSFELRGMDRVLVSGPNGTGKTTLLQTLLGLLPPVAGSVQYGAEVQVGYFAQHHDSLDGNKTVLAEFLSTERMRAVPHNPRSVLAAFLFVGDAVNKRVSDLSYGERVRLLFAKLVYQDNQLLVLDEPTNHLDVASREVVEQALRQYAGALVVVSHDRYFVDAITLTKELVLDVVTPTLLYRANKNH